MSAPDAHNLTFETRAAHAGLARLGEAATEGETIPSVRPVYMSNTFVASSAEEMDRVFAGERPGYVYTRYANPTLAELERAVALLEGAAPESGVAFGSGMAAIHAALLSTGLSSGDRIVASRDLYGQTWATLNGTMRKLGVDTTFVDATNLEEVAAAIRRVRPRLVVVETVSNPLLRVAPIADISEIARSVAASVLVDNTFASPYIVNPLDHGAAIVVHSATKYLGGHGDTTGGVAVSSDPKLADEMRRVRREVGGVLSPHDAWLITRGLRTLSLRMQRQCENAAQLAQWLLTHPRVQEVYYPGLDPMPLKRLYGTDLGGAMLSFVIEGAGRSEVFAFMDRLRLILPATTLGDLSTLVLYPAMASHRSMEPQMRHALGISDGLVRISVGIEGLTDIINDLQYALKRSSNQITLQEGDQR